MSGSEPTLPVENVAEILGVDMAEMEAMLRVVRNEPGEPDDEAILTAMHERGEEHRTGACGCNAANWHDKP